MATRYARQAGLTEDTLDSNLLVGSETSTVVLGGTAPAIWARLDQARTLDELVQGLSTEFAGDRAVIARDVKTALDELLRAGVVVETT
jgi:hypothetical protein